MRTAISCCTTERASRAASSSETCPDRRNGRGTFGERKCRAPITDRYTPDSLAGRLVVAVINFPKKQIGPLQSECLVTGFHDAQGHVVLCVPDSEVPTGTKLL